MRISIVFGFAALSVMAVRHAEAQHVGHAERQTQLRADAHNCQPRSREFSALGAVRDRKLPVEQARSAVDRAFEDDAERRRAWQQAVEGAYGGLAGKRPSEMQALFLMDCLRRAGGSAAPPRPRDQAATARTQRMFELMEADVPALGPSAQELLEAEASKLDSVRPRAEGEYPVVRRIHISAEAHVALLPRLEREAALERRRAEQEREQERREATAKRLDGIQRSDLVTEPDATHSLPPSRPPTRGARALESGRPISEAERRAYEDDARRRDRQQAREDEARRAADEAIARYHREHPLGAARDEETCRDQGEEVAEGLRRTGPLAARRPEQGFKDGYTDCMKIALKTWDQVKPHVSAEKARQVEGLVGPHQGPERLVGAREELADLWLQLPITGIGMVYRDIDCESFPWRGYGASCSQGFATRMGHVIGSALLCGAAPLRLWPLRNGVEQNIHRTALSSTDALRAVAAREEAQRAAMQRFKEDPTARIACQSAAQMVHQAEQVIGLAEIAPHPSSR